MIDHSVLRYLFEQPNLNFGKSRWLAMLSEFYFEIRYIKRKENMVANAFSRRVQGIHIAFMSSYGTELWERILQGGQHDDMYHQLNHKLQQ